MLDVWCSYTVKMIYTPGSLSNMNITDVPSVFKTDGQLDPNKLPREGCGYRCPVPETLKDNPEDVEDGLKKHVVIELDCVQPILYQQIILHVQLVKKTKMTYYGDKHH